MDLRFQSHAPGKLSTDLSADAFFLDHLSRAAYFLVYFGVTAVGHAARTGNVDVEFVRRINIHGCRAGDADVGVAGAQLVRIDFACAGRADFHRLALARSHHRRGACRSNLELVVFHSRDIELSGAGALNTGEIWHGDSQFDAATRRVALGSADIQHSTTNICLDQRQNVIVGFDLHASVLHAVYIHAQGSAWFDCA